MKRYILALVALFTIAIQASAISYEQAREQALFLTDKMAYELNLTDDQYEAAYEINLDYLMSIGNYEDLYGTYWRQRNLDLSYILLDWQYRSYVNATYFYRPLYWNAGYWHFSIYARYPHRDYYFFGQPHFYVSYRGGHSWRTNGGRSWYHGRQFGSMRAGEPRTGMRDGFNRGDFGRGISINSQASRSFGNGSRTNSHQGSARSFGRSDASRSYDNRNTRSFGDGATRSFGNDSRQSSTRATVTRPTSARPFGRSTSTDAPRSTFTPNNSRSRSFGSSSNGNSGTSRFSGAPTRSSSSFGNSNSGAGRSFGGANGSTRSFGGGHAGGSRTGGGHFGGGR